MIRVINVLRANLVHREIEDTIQRAVSPPTAFHHIAERLVVERKLHRVERMMGRFGRLRARQWGLWKHHK